MLLWYAIRETIGKIILVFLLLCTTVYATYYVITSPVQAYNNITFGTKIAKIIFGIGKEITLFFIYIHNTYGYIVNVMIDTAISLRQHYPMIYIFLLPVLTLIAWRKFLQDD